MTGAAISADVARKFDYVRYEVLQCITNILAEDADIAVEQLVWDEGNVAHIARHQVTPEKDEEVVWSDSLASSTYAGRLRLIGLTRAGRIEYSEVSEH